MNESELFEDIICKFLWNLPKEEKENLFRLSFHIKKAFYYFCDVVKKFGSIADTSRIKENFLELIAKYAKPWMNIEVEKIIACRKHHKETAGAIIFNENRTKVLVIFSKKYGFPKGGYNEGEKAEDCAVRETFEEVGLFIENKINPIEKVKFKYNEYWKTYFIVNNVGDKETITIDKREIEFAYWMPIRDFLKKIGTKAFSRESQIAWEEYENKSPEIVAGFIAHNRSYSKPDPPLRNPLTNFKLNINLPFLSYPVK